MSSAKTTEAAAVVARGDELALFHRALAQMCRAGVPLPKAFRLLRDDLRARKLRDAVDEMADDVERGVPLAEAYARHKAQFPALYRALVEVGLASGDLPGVLEEIARHATQRAAAAARIRKALAYPLVAAGFVVAVGLGLLLFVGPTLWGLSEGIVESSGAGYARVSLVLLAGLAGAGLVYGWVRGPLDAGGGRRFRLPVLGRFRLYAGKASFAATLALLLRREVPLPTALALAAEACDDAALRDDLRAMAAKAEGGEGLGEVLRDRALFPPTLLWLVGMADGGRDTPRALDEVAAIYTRRLDRALDRFATIVTPLAEIVVGAVVFLFAYSFMVPLYEYAVEIFRL